MFLGNDDDLQFLVSETLNCECQSRFEDRFNPVFTSIIPSGPGLWFRLKRSGDTFLVQTKVCESLSLVSDQLAISEDEAFSSWFWWEIDSIDVANYVSAQMKAKRFSLFEERVCNLGDPGLSWWFFQEQDRFDIFFKNSYFFEDKKLQRLGPMGDPLLARKTFLEFAQLLRNFFPDASISCNDNQFSVQNIQLDEHFLFLQKAIGEGSFESLNQLMLFQYAPYLEDYFYKLVATRNFWLEVEKILYSF